MSTGKLDKKNGEYAHHFNNAEHEFKSSIEGVWIFLTSEILMFGALFVGYFIYSNIYPDVFKLGSLTTDWRLGATNTLVLLLSSWTMALGIYYCQKNDKEKAFFNLMLTIVCGAVFMVIKYFEYTHKIHEGWMPGMWFSGLETLHHVVGDGVNIPDNIPLYYSFYFMMTGLHGIHVLAGMALVGWVAIRTKRGEFNQNYYTPVEGVGLFWHLIDLIWIFLFPLLYLV
jgi:cytochrome c oxidase subunit 3